MEGAFKLASQCLDGGTDSKLAKLASSMATLMNDDKDRKAEPDGKAEPAKPAANMAIDREDDGEAEIEFATSSEDCEDVSMTSSDTEESAEQVEQAAEAKSADDKVELAEEVKSADEQVELAEEAAVTSDPYDVLREDVDSLSYSQLRKQLTTFVFSFVLLLETLSVLLVYPPLFSPLWIFEFSFLFSSPPVNHKAH